MHRVRASVLTRFPTGRCHLEEAATTTRTPTAATSVSLRPSTFHDRRVMDEAHGCPRRLKLPVLRVRRSSLSSAASRCQPRARNARDRSAGGQDSDGASAQAPMSSRCSSVTCAASPTQRGRGIPCNGSQRRPSAIESDPELGMLTHPRCRQDEERSS